MTAFPTYSTGTVAVANGATAITGTGSNWTGANAKPGDDIVVDGHTVVVLDVTDATHLAIDAWPYTSVVAGASYKIIKRSPLRFVGGDAMADVSTLVAALNTDGFYVFVGPTETVPDPSFGEEDQFALQPSTGKLWLKTGGAWVFQGVYKGFNITGAWSGATAYAVGDVVSLAGSSYLCLLAHTNHTPPNATYWVLLAEKGDQGIQGNTGAGYGGTSTTSLTIGTGSKAFTTQAGLAYLNGARVRASSTANTSNWMEGLVTYSGTTLTMTSDKTNGSGTIASWNLNVVGQPGAGDLTAANNLSDVSNAATSLNNLSGVSYGASQSLTSVQRDQARRNAGVYTGGGYANIFATGSSSTITITAAAVALFDSSGNMFGATTVSLSLVVSGSGANGLDSGSIGTGQYYYFVIYNPTTDTVAALASASLGPTMPSGYTYKRRIGWFNYNGGITSFVQRNAQFTWATPRSLASGTQVSAAYFALALFVSPSASRVFGYLISNNNSVTVGDNVGNVIAQSAITGSSQCYFNWSFTPQNTTYQMQYTSSSAGGALGITGWEDNI